MEIEPFENPPCHLADDTGVVDDQARLHCLHSTLGGRARRDAPLCALSTRRASARRIGRERGQRRAQPATGLRVEKRRPTMRRGCRRD